ncbi:50S ribosomal protein L29 [Candidatus Gracilibacteria bacterium]|nr:50S ribosomal protein L29 [Candidatus Gracilibacteria bacterium]
MKEIKDLNMQSKDALAKLSADKIKAEKKMAEKLLYTLRMKLAVGELKQTHLVKALRRYIASLATIAQSKS